MHKFYLIIINNHKLNLHIFLLLLKVQTHYYYNRILIKI